MADLNIRIWTRNSGGVFHHFVKVNNAVGGNFYRVNRSLEKVRALVEGIEEGLALVGKSVSIEGEFFDVREDSGSEYAWPGYVKNVLLKFSTKWKQELL